MPSVTDGKNIWDYADDHYCYHSSVIIPLAKTFYRCSIDGFASQEDILLSVAEHSSCL